MRLPAEWEPQEYVLFTFPNRQGDWGAELDDASRAMLRAAGLVQQVCPVILIVGDADHFAKYADLFKGQVVHLPTNDCWVRDYGPITYYKDGARLANAFTFNGWGGKFAANLDDAVAVSLFHELGLPIPIQPVELELEGGAIDSNGEGVFLTTSKCLLNPNRNQGVATRKGMEQLLASHLGARLVHWLDYGELAGDDTDAHVDTLARFIGANTIAFVSCDDPADAHYGELQKMAAQIGSWRNSHGEPYELIPLPWCPEIYSRDDGHRLPATYANFLICNGSIFVPTYFDEEPADHPGSVADQRALSCLRALGTYTVTPVPCRAFIEQHGSLHCLTMQIPG